MKLTRIIALSVFALGGFGLVPQAHAGWWWHRHPRAVVVVGGPAYYGYGYGYGGCYVRRLVPTPWGPRWRLINRCY